MKKRRKPWFLKNDLFCEHCIYFKGWSEDCQADECYMGQEAVYQDDRKQTQAGTLDPCIHVPTSLKNQTGGYDEGPIALPISEKDEEIWRFFE